MDPVFFLFVLLPAAILTVAWGSSTSSARPPSALPDPDADALERERLESVARRLGLRVESTGLLSGRIDDMLIHALPVDEAGRRWKLSVRHLVWVPPGNEVFEVPGARRWETPSEDFRWLVEAPAVRAAIASCATWSMTLRRTLELEVPESDLEDALSAALDLCRALEQRRQGAVDALGRRLGVGAVDGSELEATFRGSRVRVVLPRPGRDAYTASVRVELRDPLPRNTLILGQDFGRGRSTELGDLFLDSAIHACTSDPEAVRARLARDAVRGPLLELLNERPGSKLESDALVAVFSKGALDIDARVAEVLALVEAMEP